VPIRIQTGLRLVPLLPERGYRLVKAAAPGA